MTDINRIERGKIEDGLFVTSKKSYRLDEQGNLRFSVSKIQQGKLVFYSLTMYSDVLAATSFVTSRREDPETGFQRLLNKEKAQDIANYIDSGGTIPTAIILSAQPEAEIAIDRNKTLIFKPVDRAFMVIDGQHRAWGFSLASKRIRVPVIIYNNLSRAEESRIFIDINTKQSKVPNELILDIKSQAGIEPSEESILGEIFNYFSDNDDSSLKGKMAPSEKEAGKITRVTFNESIKLIIDRFEDKTPYHIYSRLNIYFSACLAHFSKLGIASNFFNPNTFKAFVALYPIVVAQTRLRRSVSVISVDDFYEILKIPMDNSAIKTTVRGRISSYKSAVSQVNKAFEASIVL